jgi:hypothetical protein
MSARTRVFPAEGEYICKNKSISRRRRTCLPGQEYFPQEENMFAITRVLCLTEKGLVKAVPSDPLKYTVVFNVLCKRNQCVAERYPAWPI